MSAALKRRMAASSKTSNAGDFRCGNHNFTTNDPMEWDEHKVKTGHREEGTAPCLYCGIAVTGSFKYPGMGKPIPAICDNCKNEVFA